MLASGLLGIADPPQAAPVTAELTPDAIYIRAVRAMKSEPMPSYVVFEEDVRARNATIDCNADGTSLSLRHGDAAAHYRVWFRVSDGSSVTQDSTSHRICRGALLRPAGAEIASLGAAHGPSPDAIASPDASPDPSAAAPGDSLGETGLGGPALIGSVRVEASRYYRITLVARERFEGHDVYRLALHAYRDPNTHPLTEMLVDTETMLVRRASGEVSGHYVIASGRGAGTVVFDRAGPYWVVRDEEFELAANALFIHAHTKLVVRASDYVYADALPGIAFPTPEPTARAKSRAKG